MQKQQEAMAAQAQQQGVQQGQPDMSGGQAPSGGINSGGQPTDPTGGTSFDASSLL